MSVVSGLALPADWDRRRFDRCFVRSQVAGASDREPLSVFLDAGVVPRASRADNRNELGADLDAYLRVEVDDLVFNKLRTWQGGFGRSRHQGIVSPAYFVCRPLPGISSGFVDYLLHSAPYLAELVRISKWQPPSQFDTPWEQLRMVAFTLPSEEHQHWISDFLDRECQRIEALRAAVRRLRARRDELVTAVILEQLSGADDPGRRIEHGLAWLPPVPVAWPLLQIRRLARTGTGHTPSRADGEYWDPEDCTIPWFTLADVWQIRHDEVETVKDTAERVSQLGIDNSSAELHPAGTVLLSRTASVGFSAVMDADMAVSQDFMTWTCSDRLDPFFLLYALRAMRPELHRLTSGSTHKTIYMPDLHALQIPLPPVDEQRRIVERIRAQIGTVARLGDLDDRLDARLTEYRDALITEAVTGQLDVAKLSDAQLDESAHAALEGEVPEVLAR